MGTSLARLACHGHAREGFVKPRVRQGTLHCDTKTCQTLRSEPYLWRTGEVQSPCPSRGSHQSWRCRRPLEPARVTANTTAATSIQCKLELNLQSQHGERSAVQPHSPLHPIFQTPSGRRIAGDHRVIFEVDTPQRRPLHTPTPAGSLNPRLQAQIMSVNHNGLTFGVNGTGNVQRRTASQLSRSNHLWALMSSAPPRKHPMRLVLSAVSSRRTRSFALTSKCLGEGAVAA